MHTETKERVEDIAARYRSMVQANHTDDQAKQQEYARSLLTLVTAFRPDTRQALHDIFIELFFRPKSYLSSPPSASTQDEVPKTLLLKLSKARRIEQPASTNWHVAVGGRPSLGGGGAMAAA